MRFRLFALFGALAVFCLSIPAQVPNGFLTVTGTAMVDSTGVAMANGTLCAQPVGADGKPISIRTGATTHATVTTAQVCTTVINGAFSMLLPDGAFGVPKNACYALTLEDSTTGDATLLQGYTCVQPSSTSPWWCTATTCILDNLPPYSPPLTPSAPSGAYPTVPTVLSLNASDTGASYSLEVLSGNLDFPPIAPGNYPTSFKVNDANLPNTTYAVQIATVSTPGVAPPSLIYPTTTYTANAASSFLLSEPATGLFWQFQIAYGVLQYAPTNGGVRGPKGDDGPQGLPGCAVGSTCTADLDPRSLNSYVVNVSLYGGSTLDQQLASAIAAWSATTTPLLFVLDASGTISAPVTIPLGADLQIRSSALTLSSQITFGGSNHLQCVGGASVSATIEVPLLLAGDGFEADGCVVAGTNSNNAVFINTNGHNHTRLHDNRLTGIGIANLAGGTDHIVWANSVAGPSSTPLSTGYGLLITGDATYVTALANHFSNIINCIEFFNADADPNHNSAWGSASSPRAYVAARGGHYLFDDNHCQNSTAGFWGSVAHDVKVANSSVNGCLDVGIDFEGVQDATSSGNDVTNCTNGNYSLFFYANHMDFGPGTSTSTGSAKLLNFYNASLLPTEQSDISVHGMTFTCIGCTSSMGGDPISDFYFKGNILHNVYVAWSSYGSRHHYENNNSHFDQSPGTSFTALSTPSLIGGGVSTVAGNTLTTSVALPAGSVGINAVSTDFNLSNTVLIHNNTITGYPVDLSTTNGGGNSGVASLQAYLWDNFAGSNNVQHHVTGAMPDVYVDYGELTYSGRSVGYTPSSHFGGAATAPTTGTACSVVGWVLGDDGHLSYCNGTTYTQKF